MSNAMIDDDDGNDAIDTTLFASSTQLRWPTDLTTISGFSACALSRRRVDDPHDVGVF
jgi:hypothetical protein